MPPTNPRKRPAPGSPPAIPAQQMQQAYSSPSQLTNEQLLRWSQGGDNTGYSDPSAYNNIGSFSSNSVSNPQYQPSVPAPSTQLTRRPMNRSLVATASRPPYDSLSDPWGSFGDDSLLDTQVNGIMEENDSIELLEERAAMAKRDAQSKRKQIPPFVQKLSR
jgi:heat shock transcription factor